MSQSSDVISVRNTRLTKAIIGRNDAASKEGLSRDKLLDAFIVLFDECNRDKLKRNDRNVNDFVKKYRGIVEETKMQRVNLEDFTVKSLIGKGYFGDVHLVTEKCTNDVYAMKKIRKTALTSSQVREERDIMVMRSSDWITSLQYAFQDAQNLYLVMEYLPGGDLLSLMIRNGAFEEEHAQFYLAEMIMSLNALHTMGYVHRDVKPENILLDRCGHLKLADFGNAALVNKDGNVISLSPVGTPDYIAPELLKIISSQEKGSKAIHDVSCDYWSLGIIGYELVTEVTPFHHDNVHQTYAQILAHCEKSSASPKLKYPENLMTSEPFRHLIENLLTGPENRLTHDRLVKHPFFRGVKWSELRHQVPPIIPSLHGNDDVSNFEDIDGKSRRNTFVKKQVTIPSRNGDFSGQNLPFIGYTFVHEADAETPEELQRPTEKHHAAKAKEISRMSRVQCDEIRTLQGKLLLAEKRIDETTSTEKQLKECRGEMSSMKEQLREKLKELASCRTEVKTLKSALKIEEDQRVKNENTIKEVLQSTYKKWEKNKNLSDQAYEKQIAEKATQIAHLNEKLQINEKELEAKASECRNFLETIDNYRELLKKSKDQLATDRMDFERTKKDLAEVYDSKIHELKKSLKEEKENRRKEENRVRELKMDLDSIKTTQTSLQEAKRTSDRTTTDFRERMNQEIEENRKIREENANLERDLEMLRVKIDDVERENQVLLGEIEKQASESHRTSLVVEENFQSCKGSWQDLNQAEAADQLRTDLEKANERWLAEQKRADEFETIIKRLETVISRLESTPRSTRTGVEVEKTAAAEQQARTAMLSMWKLEKQIDDLTNEKKLQARRMELSEQKLTRLREDKSEMEIKWKTSVESLASKDREIERLQKEIDHLKAAVEKENQQWRNSERELMEQKTQVVERMAKIENLDQIIDEGKRTLRNLQQKNDNFSMENKKLLQELSREREEAHRAKENAADIQTDLDKLNTQYKFLKEACNVTEIQLTELEELVATERKMNAEQKIRLNELVEKLRTKDEDLLKFKQNLHTLEGEKREVEGKVLQTQNDLSDAREQLEHVTTKLLSQETNLTGTTSVLLETQEQLELTKLEVENLQMISNNFQQELTSMKQESTRILTDFYNAKDEISRLTHELNEAALERAEQKHEIDHLNGLLSEQKNYYVQRDIKNEATLAQHKKLIDYLQVKVEELSHKKKSTLLDKLFGGSDSSKKENITPNIALMESAGRLKQTQEQLRRERHRNSQLTEKLLKAKTELRTMKEPAAPAWEEVKQASDVEVEQELRSDFQKREEETLSRQSTGKRTYRMHHLEMTMEGGDEPNVNCLVCHDPIMTSNTFWRCRVCLCTVHRKCRGKVTSSCDGEPTLAPVEAIDEVDTKVQTKEKVCDTLSNDSYRGELLFKPKDLSPPVLVHCVYEVNEETLLLGCETGLYSYHVQESKKLVPIGGLDCVNYIAITPTLAKVILIVNGGKCLYQCDLRHLLARGRRTPGYNQITEKLEVSVLELPFANRQINERWHFVRIRGDNEHLDDAMVIAATTSRIVIMRFDTGIGKFKPTKALDTATPVTGVLFTRHTAIVSSDKFFEIDLDSLAAEEFVDLSDSTLAVTRSWQPLAAYQVTESEFLLCFAEFGTFTDEYGCRSRPSNISWTYTPTGFSFRNGILFITHFNSIQVMRIRRFARQDRFSHTSDIDDSVKVENAEAEMKIFIQLSRPEIVNSAGRHGVYVLTTENETDEQKIVLVDGLLAFGEGLSGSLDTLATTSTSTSSSSPVTSTSGSLKRVKSFAV
ncbi:citron rho-interacting kinase [Sergentomyia squamirostris]